MKTSIITGLIALGLSVGLTTVQGAEENEQELKSSDVPAAVQQAGENAAKGGKIIRWEKEGANFEAVVQKKNGKQVGIEISPDAKVLGKHNESKEHKENH